MRAGIDLISINPDAAVFTRKLVASIEQRIMLEKALGQVKVDPDEEYSHLTVNSFPNIYFGNNYYFFLFIGFE